jgi:hypothetical protein
LTYLGLKSNTQKFFGFFFGNKQRQHITNEVIDGNFDIAGESIGKSTGYLKILELLR